MAFCARFGNAIAHQYDTLNVDSGLFACVFSANQISKQLGFGFAGNPVVYQLPTQVEKTMGGTLEQLIANADDLNASFEEAKLFANL